MSSRGKDKKARQDDGFEVFRQINDKIRTDCTAFVDGELMPQQVKLHVEMLASNLSGTDALLQKRIVNTFMPVIRNIAINSMLQGLHTIQNVVHFVVEPPTPEDVIEARQSVEEKNTNTDTNNSIAKETYNNGQPEQTRKPELQ